MRQAIITLCLVGVLWPTGLWAQEGEDSEDLGVITVQGRRPDWENTLSPGSVDVVVPDDFAGEQKDLPAFLETIPGLHVRRRGGDGQYSTLTVRGSSAAQVKTPLPGRMMMSTPAKLHRMAIQRASSTFSLRKKTDIKVTNSGAS